MSSPKLIILRGNSGSGKSAVAKRLREASERRTALVGQDSIRREILGEIKIDNGENIALIEFVVGFALDRGLMSFLKVYLELIDTVTCSDGSWSGARIPISIISIFHLRKPCGDTPENRTLTSSERKKCEK